jgi:hypothetical protein
MKQILIFTLTMLTITLTQAKTFDCALPFSGDNYFQGIRNSN